VRLSQNKKIREFDFYEKTKSAKSSINFLLNTEK